MEEEAIYSEIYTITGKGIEKLDKLPENIVLFLSTNKNDLNE